MAQWSTVSAARSAAALFAAASASNFRAAGSRPCASSCSASLAAFRAAASVSPPSRVSFPWPALEAIPHRPCLAAGRLHHEIEPPAASVGYLPARLRRLQVLDEFGGEPAHFCYPASLVGNKIGCLRLLPNVGDNARQMATEQVFLAITHRKCRDTSGCVGVATVCRCHVTPES